MIGNLGQVGLESIQGWGYSKSDNSPVKISILLDDQLIDEVLANISRPDVLETQLNAQLNCGFSYQFPKNIVLSQYKQLSVIFSKNRVNLNGSPFNLGDMVDTDWKVVLDSFFIHIPKTAGTSFRLELLNHFGEDALFPNHHDLTNSEGNYLKAETLNVLPNRRKSSISILSGHYSLKIKNELAPNCNGLTFLREPISRAISNLKHIQRHAVNFREKTLLEIAQKDSKRFPEVTNRQCIMLWDEKDIDEKHNSLKAFENLSCLAFFGITEHYQASIKLCNKVLNWNLKGDVFANSAEKGQQDIQVNNELITYLKEQNKADIELYERALSLFKIRCHENGIEL